MKSKTNLVKWQYKVTHHFASCFKIGEIVFLKSCPEIELFVEDILFEENKVLVLFIDDNENENLYKLNPHSILQFKFAAFIYEPNFNFEICLN